MSFKYTPLTAHATWAADPLIPGDWRDLSLAEALPLLMRLLVRIGQPKIVKLFMECFPTRVRAMRPTFYPGWIFADVQAALPDGTIGLCNFLYGKDAVLVLNGTAPAIHKLNSTGALKIENSDQAADYLRFFCSAVHGDEGRFAVLEHPDAAYGRGRASAPNAEVNTWLAQAGPLSVTQHDGVYDSSALLRYGVHLFRVSLRLTAGGQVEMTDDEPIGDLEMEPEVFRPPFWVMSSSEQQVA